MRCEPGELAIVDKLAASGTCACFFGMPVVVTTAYAGLSGKMYWNVAPPLKTAACPHYRHIGPLLRGIDDEMLRPIRDPRVSNAA